MRSTPPSASHTTHLRLRVSPERPHHAVDPGPRAHPLGIATESIPRDAVQYLHLLGDLGHDGPEIGARTRALKGRLGHFARPEGRDEPFRARALAEPALQRTDDHPEQRELDKTMTRRPVLC